MILLVAAGLLLGSCGGTEVLSTNDEQRELWDSAGVTAYEYELALDCFCPPEVAGPFNVAVADGAAVEVARVTSPQDPVAVDEIMNGTIEAIFDFIGENADADLLEVTYHAELGYPVTVVVDPSDGVLDDELSITVQSFRSSDG